MNEKQVTLEEYIKSNYPGIYESYKEHVKVTKKLTVADICNMQLDTKGLSAKAVKELKELDISTVGKLVRVIIVYGSVEWVQGVGVATTNRLHDTLRKYNINVKEPYLTDKKIIEYSMLNCIRDLDISIECRIDSKTCEVLYGIGVETIMDIIKYIKSNGSFDMVKSLAGYQRDNIMRLLDQYAKYPECIQYEFI